MAYDSSPYKTNQTFYNTYFTNTGKVIAEKTTRMKDNKIWNENDKNLV